MTNAGYRRPGHQSIAGVLLACTLFCPTLQADPADKSRSVCIRLTVTTPLKYANTPLDPSIDFADLIARAGASGVFDPNSVEVYNPATGERVPHAISEDFAYSDKGRIEFVIGDPTHREFLIRFATADERPRLELQSPTPQIGVGDLLCYNAGQARPINVSYSAGLEDLNGDGRLDLTGSWNYAHRPGWPWDGIFCYDRTPVDGFEFAALARLRFTQPEPQVPRFFSHIYMAIDFADFNRDGRLDLVVTRRSTNLAEFYLDSGTREVSGLPRFKAAGSVQIGNWQACCAVDLDKDGAVDLVVDGTYLRNENRAGWPFRSADPVQLDAGRHPCFLDVDADGRLDAVCLHGAPTTEPNFYKVAWRRNLGGTPPQFDAERLLDGVDLPEVSQVTSWHAQSDSGLIVQHGVFQELSIFRLQHSAG